MVALAPHLVHPLPLVVAAFDGQRPDRVMGMGLNLYDVMAVERRRGRLARRLGRRTRRASRPRRAGARTATASIDGDEVVKHAPRARRSASPPRGYLFYDCQTDDSRLVLTVLGEAERFGTVMANGVEVTELVEEAGRAIGRPGPRRRQRRASSTCRADNVVNATGVWADRLRPEELHDEAEVPTDPPEPRHAHHAPPRGRPARRRRDRPRRRRAVDLRAARGWAARSSARPTTTTTATSTTSRRPSDDVDYLLEATNALLRHRPRREATSPAPTRASGR